MKKLTNEEKVAAIKKYYRKNPTFLELQLINYEKYNIYICINKISNDSYRISWFDLDDIDGKKIEDVVSCQYIASKSIDLMRKDFSKFIVSSDYQDEFLTGEDTVVLKADLKTKEDKCVDVTFKKYLPNSLAHLADLFIFIFNNMPRRFEEFLFEILARLTRTTEKYEYKKEFDFDLFEDDIDKLFEYQICQRGKKYYEESKIKFLEKIDDRYFAVVEGTEKYLTIIKFKEEEKKMQVYCSCPCEFYCKHMYAVILAIRNKEFNRFYKIIYNNPNKSLLERVLNSDYLICLGVVEQNLEIINGYGEFELVPILDVDGKCNWRVLEDSEDEELIKQIKYFLDNN